MKRKWILACVLGATACAGYRPAPLSIAVTTDPSGARAQLICPNERPRSGVTPVTFRIPQYAVSCELLLSKPGFQDERRELTSDELDRNRVGHAPASPPPPPLTFQPGATPLTLLSALFTRWLDNVGTSVAERTSTMLVPDVRLHVELSPDSR
jgi:hypothetical protein